VHPEIWEVLHQLTTYGGLHCRGDCGLHGWPKGREYEVNKLSDTGADEDEAHEKASERNAPEEPQRREGIEHWSEEGEP
jgi:hypothetical protein